MFANNIVFLVSCALPKGASINNGNSLTTESMSTEVDPKVLFSSVSYPLDSLEYQRLSIQQRMDTVSEKNKKDLVLQLEAIEQNIDKIPEPSSLVGIRIAYDDERNLPYIDEVIQNSAAQAAGLQEGDYLLKIEEDDLSSWSISDVIGRLKGPAGTTFNMTIERYGETLSKKVTKGDPSKPFHGFPLTTQSNLQIGVDLNRPIRTCTAFRMDPKYTPNIRPFNYLTSLRCLDGNVPFIERLGSNIGGFDNPTDVFSLQCSNGEEQRIFVDSYHCEELDPLVQIGSLKPYYIVSETSQDPFPERVSEGDLIEWANMSMVELSKGMFLWDPRDSEQDDIEVQLTRGFLISHTEVTSGLYNAVMKAENKEDSFMHPKVGVSWEDTIRFCNRLSEMEGLEPVYDIQKAEPQGDYFYKEDMIAVTWNKDANGYRLLSEAEWFYAANADQGTFYAGDNDHLLVGWSGPAVKEPQRVGQKMPNAWGLYDMSGNVSEWVFDRKCPLPDGPLIDPVFGEKTRSGEFEIIDESLGYDLSCSKLRVYKGGSFIEDGWGARGRPLLEIAARVSGSQADQSNSRGFRIARTVFE